MTWYGQTSSLSGCQQMGESEKMIDLRAEDKSQNPASSPGFGLLLQLQNHIPALLVILEKVDIVDNEDIGLATLLGRAQSHLFQLVESYGP